MSYALAFLFLCLTVHLGATKYYIDSSDGDNSKNGMTPENAWKTLQRIRDSGPEPGDTFLLQRGEIWEGVQLRISHSGLVGQPIVYGSEPLPIISMSHSQLYLELTLYRELTYLQTGQRLLVGYGKWSYLKPQIASL